jgi:hypothetical protein
MRVYGLTAASTDWLTRTPAGISRWCGSSRDSEGEAPAAACSAHSEGDPQGSYEVRLLSGKEARNCFYRRPGIERLRSTPIPCAASTTAEARAATRSHDYPRKNVIPKVPAKVLRTKTTRKLESGLPDLDSRICGHVRIGTTGSPREFAGTGKMALRSDPLAEETPAEKSGGNFRLVVNSTPWHTCRVKQLTRKHAQARKDAAVRFVDYALGDPDWADEIADEDLEDWAARKKIQLINSTRRNVMPGGNGGNGRTKQDLLDEIGDLQQENQDLQDQLNAIADIVGPPEQEDGEDDDDE